MERTRRIVGQAKTLGFELCGVAPAEKFPELEHLPEWLERGYAGEMRYLHNPKRHSPELVLPGARSVIVCAMNYNTPLSYSTEARAMSDVGPGRVSSRHVDAEKAKNAGTQTVPVLQPHSARGWISRYAWGDDYHEVLGARLEKLVAWMRREFAEPHESRWYVDTGPIVERMAAKWAGLGWLGKNTCLINQELGSWLFLGVVITTLDLRPAVENFEPPPDLCGQCTLCIDACPTEALVEPYVLDARRCISYLTIELRGPIPEEFQDKLGWHIFGCDICQDVCPYNRKAPVTAKPEFMPRSTSHFAPSLQWAREITEQEFAATFARSPVLRTKWQGWVRNASTASRRPKGTSARAAPFKPPAPRL